MKRNGVIKHDRDNNNTMLDLERLRNFAFDGEVLHDLCTS